MLQEGPSKIARALRGKRLVLGCLAIICGCVCSAVHAGDDESAGRIRDRHIEQLGWLMESWSSLEIEISADITRPSSAVENEIAGDRSSTRYVETAEGQRYFDSYVYRAGAPIYRSIHAFDGRKGAAIAYDRRDTSRQQQVILKDQFSLARPNPLFHLWIGPMELPLREALQNATYMGGGSLIGRDCDVFLVSGMGTTGQSEGLYSLDRTTSLPLRVVFYLDSAERAEGRVYFDWKVEELGKVQGYPYARRSVQVRPAETNGRRAEMVTRTVESLQFNKEYPLAFFRPELQPGAVVFDTITNQPAYVVGGAPPSATGPGKTAPASSAPRPAGTPPGATPLAVQRPRRASEIAAPVALGLGALILSSSLVLLWRRRGAG
jgi:hypothetical protein